MSVYLFSWNPIKWPWPALEKDIQRVRKGNKLLDKWSCASHRTIQPGDRAFFVRVAQDPKGIFASGYIVSNAFREPKNEVDNKLVYRVNVVYDVLIDPCREPILTLDLLELSDLRRQQWTPQSAGISIRPELVEELEAVWADFLKTHDIRPLNKEQLKWK